MGYILKFEHNGGRMIEIRVIHGQCGMTVEARNGGDWQTVQSNQYREREASPSVRQYRTCINPAQDEADYFAMLDAKGVQYRKVRA